MNAIARIIRALHLSLVVTTTAVLFLLLPIQASANSGSGGNGTIKDNGGSDDKEIITPTHPSDPLVLNFGDAWEVTLYIDKVGSGTYKRPVGSFMLYGDQTVWASPGGSENFLMQLDWGKSHGLQHSTNNSGGGIDKRRVEDCPPWEKQHLIKAWGTDPDTMNINVLGQLIQQGDLDAEIAKKIMDQMKNPPDIETIEEGIADGTIIDWTVSMEPIQLLYYPATVIVGNGQLVGTNYFDFNKRQEHYSEWAGTNRGTAWVGICNQMSHAFIVEYMDRNVHNQPHEWVTTTKWPNNTGSKPDDNYYIFTPNFTTTPPPPPPPPPEIPGIPPEVGFDEIRIMEKELLANIPVDWNKDDSTNSNVLAENIEQIKIKERTNDVGGKRIHEVYSDGTCDHKDESDDDEEEPDECGASLVSGTYCDQAYTFTWTVNPKAKMNEDKLKTVDNVLGNGVNLDNPFSSTTKDPTKYQMTRLNGIMDLEFSKKNDVFKEYTWKNSNTDGKQEKGPTGAKSYQSTTNYATHEGDEPTPFNAGFQVSFNSHRFAKWGESENAAMLSKAGGEQSFLPLAGYMMDTPANEKYYDWMNERGLYNRVEWILQEDIQLHINGMYDGNPGLNFTWGHGGNHGTKTEDSDLVWDNEWKWTRTTHTNQGTEKGSHSSSPQHKIDKTHWDTCDDQNPRNSGKEADNLDTPRACFGRTEIIEDTVRGHKNTNLVRGTEGDFPGDRTQQFDNSHLDQDTEYICYYMRQNSWKNDRVTFTIPSTIFEFSPTYKMYADYTLNTTRTDYEDVWMLASDKDTAQFRDIIDFDLQGGDTVVRAPWSRDYDDARAEDPNTNKPINVLKSGNAYHVDTSNSRLVVTAVIHHWDEDFFEENSIERELAEEANAIVGAYMRNITDMLNQISDENFGFYTNLVGGTTQGSKFRLWKDMNGEIFLGHKSTSVLGKEMTIPEPSIEDYPKLQLTVNYPVDHPELGYVARSAVVTPTSILDEYRLNGGWDVWDSIQAQKAEAERDVTLWTDPLFRQYVPDMSIYSATRLETVLVSGMGSVEKWYIEDYEGILITVVRAYIDIPAVRSNPATVYEKLSDFNSDMNQWSPMMRHPIIRTNEASAKGRGNNIIIPAGSVGAGTYLDVPDLTVYPGGILVHEDAIANWSICYEPYLFGLRGSVFDNAA